MTTYDARQVTWRIGVGRNRMRWIARPQHWMVVETMRPLDGSASWSEKAHYVTLGPLRFFIEPRLRETHVIERLAQR